jgi:hypothetical protein
MVMSSANISSRSLSSSAYYMMRHDHYSEFVCELGQEEKEVQTVKQLDAKSVVGVGGELSFLSELLQSGASGSICVKISSISPGLRSRSGWQYRKLSVEDKSMKSDILISETKFSQWEIRPGDCVVAKVRSNGIDNEGRLSFFFDDFLGPFDVASALFSSNTELYDLKTKSSEKMKSSETVYQISAREAKSLLELIKLWIVEGKPQHYTKWCQMHQIVATNLYYMGLVKRTASMSGHYYPTTEALEFFEGKRGFPKKKVFVRDKEGKHLPIWEDSDMKSFSEYLADYSDRDSALAEYKEALDLYRSRMKSDSGVIDRATDA